MDIEQLSKSQIVLLTLLVSFVTSIATGIVTVSLMDQAPPIVAQSVSRVIEKTIQTVASTTPRGQAAATVVTQEKTVVVRESDLISQAVQTASPSVVRLFSGNGEDATFAGLGVVLDAAGTIAADASALGDAADATIQLSSGARVRAFVASRDSASGLAYMRSATSTIEGKPIAFSPVGISAEHPMLGETVVLLGGKAAMRIAAGLVTALPTSAPNAPSFIQTDVAGDSILPGSPLIDTSGALIGISTSVARDASSSSFITGSVLMRGGSEKASI